MKPSRAEYELRRRRSRRAVRDRCSLLQVCKYIDIPLQHMSNLVLLGMNRPAQGHTLDLLTKLRARIPGLVLRTTFISGFPGEPSQASRCFLLMAEGLKSVRMRKSLVSHVMSV